MMPLPDPIATYVRAINENDMDALLGSFTPDALVNDQEREFWGIEAIRRWAAKEIFELDASMEPTVVNEHYGEYGVDAIIDGSFDKTNLPDPLVLTSYFSVRDGRISRLIVLQNGPPELK